MSKYLTKDSLHGLFEDGRGVLTDFWNVIEHPSFPFVTLTSTTNGSRNYPPYDMIEQADGKVRIELAAAGYTKEQLNVEKVGNTLLIAGKASTKTETIRHKGLYSAAWQRAFELQPTAIIDSVKLENGLLIVVVGSQQPPESPRTTFEIK